MWLCVSQVGDLFFHMDQTTSSDTHSPTQTDLISTIPLPPSRRNSNKRFTNHSIVTSPIKTGDKHGDYLWSNIISRVSPIFHGENIKGCIEDLNELVSVYQKEGNLDVLHSNISTMCNSGVDVLHKKLIQSTSNSSLPNDSLIIAAKVSELWSYFFTVVLPVLLASFLPFKQSGLDINIREISLTAFRNVIVLPLSSNFDGILN